MGVPEDEILVIREPDRAKSRNAGSSAKGERVLCVLLLDKIHARKRISVGEVVIQLRDALVAMERVGGRNEQRVSGGCRRNHRQQRFRSGYAELVDGSSFLVASTNDKGLYFTPSKGRSVGSDIFEQSFPILVSVTQKPFGEYLSMLMRTIWPDNEL